MESMLSNAEATNTRIREVEAEINWLIVMQAGQNGDSFERISLAIRKARKKLSEIQSKLERPHITEGAAPIYTGLRNAVIAGPSIVGKVDLSAMKMTTRPQKGSAAINQLQRCCYCNRPMDKPTREHLIPRSKGGPDKRWNIKMCCVDCNGWRGNKEYCEWRKDVKKMIDYVGGGRPIEWLNNIIRNTYKMESHLKRKPGIEAG